MSGEITLSDLIAEIGNDRVSFQMLTDNLNGTQKLVNRGRDLQVSFLTDPGNLDMGALALGQPTPREGIIMWVRRDDMNAAMTRLRAAFISAVGGKDGA